MTGAIVAASICAVLTLVNLLSIAVAVGRLRRRGRLPSAPPGAPAVSIVRPVCGIEPFIERTLASGFALDYPDYELVFCVAQSGDPIVHVVRRLMAAHPHVRARLLIGDDRISPNPKLNNCLKGWEAAAHDWIVLADSNVLMPPDYIQQLMQNWRADTGLICSTPIGSRPIGFWAEVECAFLNTLQARWQYVGESLGLGFAQGKSMLWRRDVLDTRGGLRLLAAELAEDAAATKLVRDAGLHVHLVASPFEQPLGARKPKEVWRRQIRWARLRRMTFPLFFAPEILTGAAAALLTGGLAAAALDASVPAVLIGLALVWYGAELGLAAAKGWHLSWRYPLACLARDTLIPALWTAAWLGGRVVWRGNPMVMRATGARRLQEALALVRERG